MKITKKQTLFRDLSDFVKKIISIFKKSSGSEQLTYKISKHNQPHTQTHTQKHTHTHSVIDSDTHSENHTHPEK